MTAPVWVALPRGINVGTAKRIAMADLRALLEGLGYGSVRTHGQSGNVVFTAGKATAPDLAAAFTAVMAKQAGMDVAVVVLSAVELAAVVDANPFVTRGADPKELHVTFLGEPVRAEAIAAVDRAEYAPDEFELGDRVIYTRQPNGVAGSTLPDWGRLLGTTVTARNWNTVTRLRVLAEAAG